MKEALDPFTGPSPTEVPLKNAPLVRVLAQLSFSEIYSISQRDFIASFQERIRQTYRTVRPEEMTVVSVGPAGQSVRTETVWRFYDAAEVWRVSLAPNFVSLETRIYTNRRDFVRRIAELAAAVDESFKVGGFNRIGVRYIDQVHGAPLEQLREIVDPAFLGIYAKKRDMSSVQHFYSEMVASVVEGEMSSRWGMLPANATYDINVLTPIPHPSWFLDVDVYTEALEPGKLVETLAVQDVAHALATRAYAVFKWATNEKFDAAFGG